MKRTEDSLRDLKQYQMHQHLNCRGPRRRREKERVWEKFWRDYSWKFPQHGKGSSQSSPRSTRVPYRISPRRNTPRHILIKLTKTTHKERILKAAREKQQVTYKGNNSWSFSTNSAGREWQGSIIKALKEKIYNQEYCTWQGSLSKLMEK